MRAHELDSRLLEALHGNHVFWPEAERYTSLNEAMRLLALLKPDVLVRRVPITTVADEMFLDLRELAPDLLQLEQVVVGDVSSHPPVASGGVIRHLRRTSLTSLRAYPHWLMTRHEAPQHYVRFGLYWLMTWPRSIQAQTLTLVYRATATALTHTSPNAMVGLRESDQGLVVELAAALAMAKEGSGTVQESLHIFQRIFGRERFVGLPRPKRTVAA